MFINRSTIAFCYTANVNPRVLIVQTLVVETHLITAGALSVNPLSCIKCTVHDDT